MHEGAMTSGINPLPSLNSYHIVIWNRLPKNQLPTDPPNYQNMAEGHGFRDMRAISITVRMVLGACRKLNPLEVCFQGPKYLPTNRQMSRDTSPTFTYSISTLLPIFNKTSWIHSMPMLSSHDFSRAGFAYIDQHQGWANAAQEHVAAINQNLGVAWIHFSVFGHLWMLFRMQAYHIREKKLPVPFIYYVLADWFR